MTERPKIMVSPGPVHIDPARWRDLPLMHHRSEPFREIFRDTTRMLAALLGTASPVHLVTASGTGAMEMALANCTRPGSILLVVSGGKFGDRWAEIGEAFGCRTEILSFEWGKAIEPARVVDRAREMKPDCIALTHVESSTGLLCPLEEIARNLPDPRPVVLVDAIASLGVETLRMDEWGVDAVAAASQKALAAPPGLGFVSLGERARAVADSIERPRYYFSLERYENGYPGGDTPFTPAVQTVQLVHESLTIMERLGWEEAARRHRQAASAFMEAAGRLSLRSLPETPSSAVQTFLLPDGCAGRRVIEQLYNKHGVIMAGGQQSLAGKAVRTGFLGIHSGRRLGDVVRAVGQVLGEAGFEVDTSGAAESISKISDQAAIFSHT